MATDRMAFVPLELQDRMQHYHDDFWVSRTFDPSFIGQVMYAGFLPIAMQQGRHCYLLPKLHAHRCVIAPLSSLHIPKQVRKKAKGFHMTINMAFDNVVAGCHAQHGKAWLYPPVVTAFRAMLGGIPILNEGGRQVQLVSIELWNDQNELVAGELGYTNGAMYTSLTGFTGTNGAGTMQLYALGSYLHKRGFQLWDLGMSMPYKMALGAKEVPRTEFVQLVAQLRCIDVQMIPPNLPRQCAKDLFQLHRDSHASNEAVIENLRR
ncbi:hypothetical protein DYB25_013264 [Aphanomyces astaci]|uniref:Leucyl/phenylalanyl-tRNA--protein transferase n=1 Tax=Aphanomyces astaci TaxID=112090 RepID=A0A397BZJ6_APHAT|nr:hypothetical protein DYB25_013264 [Aphanomyces astaci]